MRLNHQAHLRDRYGTALNCLAVPQCLRSVRSWLRSVLHGYASPGKHVKSPAVDAASQGHQAGAWKLDKRAYAGGDVVAFGLYEIVIGRPGHLAHQLLLAA